MVCRPVRKGIRTAVALARARLTTFNNFIVYADSSGSNESDRGYSFGQWPGTELVFYNPGEARIPRPRTLKSWG